MLFTAKTRMVGPGEALPGRAEPMPLDNVHRVLDAPLLPPFDARYRQAVFALGCFWGAERCFWTLDGVHSTSVGYCGGHTPNPTYDEVCSGRTGHAEAVSVIFDPAAVGYADLLRTFFESHDPTQGMRQGNDVGTQYRSAIYTLDDAQARAARDAAGRYQRDLERHGLGKITTEIAPLERYYYAEAHHQQYLAAHPGGYCGLGGTGVRCSGF